MGEPRHRRPRRTRGFRLLTRRGRRRRTLEDSPPSRSELAREADRAAAAAVRRRVGLAVLAALGLVAAAVGVSLLLLRAAEAPAPDPLDTVREGAGAVVAITDRRSQTLSLAYVAVHPERDAQVILFPPALLTTLPGFGEGPIARSTDFGGADLAALTVMNLMGVRVDGAAAVPAEVLAETLEGPLSVDLSRALIVTEGSSEVVRVAAGPGPRDPEVVALLLSEQGSGDQLEWLARQGDVWRALLGAIGERPGLAGVLGAGVGGVSEILATAGSDPELLVTAVPVSRIAVGGGTERYQLSGEQAAAFAGDRVPFLLLREGVRPRVEVLNGNGRVGTTRAVAQAVIRNGFRVVKTDNADHFDYRTSIVIGHGREHQEAAVRILELLGRGEVMLELRRPSGVVDLTIIVGHDIPSEEA